MNTRQILQKVVEESATPLDVYDIGDGYSLAHFGGGGFRFMRGDDIVGSLLMSRAPNSEDSDFSDRLASVQDVLIYPNIGGPDSNNHRGKGLYRRAMPVLKQLYGGIRSSHSGNTSDDAAKAWKGMGARSVLRTDSPSRYGGSWYSLESSFSLE